ncbi:MAG: uroporphyrinogen-III C-methyltransferase [Pseudomonadota bacterium]
MDSEQSSSPPPKPAKTPPLALVLALVAMVLLAWQWFDTRNQIAALQKELAQRLAEAGSYSKESRSIAEQSQEHARDFQARLALLENKLAESQSQQVALEALYQELSRSRDESVLAEIEQVLLLASQQLQISGNIKAALIALQTADARLQHLDRPQFAALRRALNRDIEQLKLAPYADIVGLSARLDGLIAAVEILPLSQEMRPPREPNPLPPAGGSESAWQRLLREVWQDFKQLVRIQAMDHPDLPLLAPDQVFFLRENLKLRLLGARLALFARDSASFKADMEAAQVWLSRYYDAQDQGVAAALAALKQFADGDIGAELPQITASLDAVRKLGQQRGAR